MIVVIIIIGGGGGGGGEVEWGTVYVVRAFESVGVPCFEGFFAVGPAD